MPRVRCCAVRGCIRRILSSGAARDAGALKELAPKARPAKRSAEQVELDRAQRRIARLEDDLAKHKLALEIQGKASELLERLLAESNEDRRQQP